MNGNQGNLFVLNDVLEKVMLKKLQIKYLFKDLVSSGILRYPHITPKLTKLREGAFQPESLDVSLF